MQVPLWHFDILISAESMDSEKQGSKSFIQTRYIDKRTMRAATVSDTRLAHLEHVRGRIKPASQQDESLTSNADESQQRKSKRRLVPHISTKTDERSYWLPTSSITTRPMQDNHDLCAFHRAPGLCRKSTSILGTDASCIKLFCEDAILHRNILAKDSTPHGMSSAIGSYKVY